MKTVSFVAAAALLAACHAAPPPAAPAKTDAAKPAAAPAKPDDKQVKREPAIDSILKAASPQVASPAEAKRLLQEARTHALPEEKPLLEHAEALTKLAFDLETIAKEPGPFDEKKKARVQPLMDKLLGGYADLLREARPLYKDDVDKQVMLAATLYTLADVDATTPHQAWKTEAMGWAKELGAKFPKAAKVARLLGSFCTHGDEELPVCIAHFARCADIDPSDMECKGERARLAKLYTAPRCTGDALKKDFGIFAATTEKKPGARELPMNGGKEKAWVEPKAAFGPSDFQGAETIFINLGLGEENEAPAVYLAVKPDRQSAVTAWLTRADQPKDGLVVVMSGGRVLASARAGQIRDGRGMTVEATADAVCTKTEARALPPELR